MPLAWLLTVFVHELGHLLAGRAAGMRPLALYAGPFLLDFSGTGMRLRTHRATALLGGLTLCLPQAEAGARHFAALVAGGPLASVLLAALASVAMLVLSGSLAGIAFLTALMSAMIALVTLVPTRSSGYLTDGAQLLALHRGDPLMQRRLVLSAMIGQSYGGTRPRDLDASLLDRVRDSGEPVVDASVLAYEAAIAQDRGDVDAARRAFRALARMLCDVPTERMPAASRRGFGLGIATWLALHEQDTAQARSWLEFSRGGFTDPAAASFAEAAVAVAEGRRADALRHIAATRAALPRVADRGGAIALVERLDALARDAERLPA